MNKFIGIGNLTKDIEMRYTTSGTAVARFTLAMKREVKNKDGSYDSDFVNCIAYGNQAELISKYLEKGSKVSVEGRIQTGMYEKDGKRVYTTDIAVEKVQFISGKK